MDDKFLEKYINSKQQFHTVASGRVYACVIGDVKDGLLLNLTPAIFSVTKVGNQASYNVGVAVRAILKGNTYLKDFEWEKRDGEKRLKLKVFQFATTLDDSFAHIVHLLTESNFFKDLEKSLKFHGSTLNAKELQELLLHTFTNLHSKDELTLTKFAFNF